MRAFVSSRFWYQKGFLHLLFLQLGVTLVREERADPPETCFSAMARAIALVRGGTPCRRALPANLASGGTDAHTTILYSDPAEFQGGWPNLFDGYEPKALNGTTPSDRVAQPKRSAHLSQDHVMCVILCS
jgi:hypothetical protein